MQLIIINFQNSFGPHRYEITAEKLKSEDYDRDTLMYLYTFSGVQSQKLSAVSWDSTEVDGRTQVQITSQDLPTHGLISELSLRNVTSIEIFEIETPTRKPYEAAPA